MLRVSATTTNTPVDLQAVMGDPDAASAGIEHGVTLMRFAEALARRDADALVAVRQELLDNAGAAVLVDAAGVAGNFQRMVRIADSIGIPVDDMTSELGQGIREDLDLQQFPSARNTIAS